MAADGVRLRWKVRCDLACEADPRTAIGSSFHDSSTPIGVTPSAQGRGVGRRLIEPTLADADAADVDCYLEIFDRRNTGFYRRLGFAEVAVHAEWGTGATYTIMRRHPRR